MAVQRKNNKRTGTRHNNVKNIKPVMTRPIFWSPEFFIAPRDQLSPLQAALEIHVALCEEHLCRGVFPAVKVYHGCPTGGESCGAFTLECLNHNKTLRDAEEIARSLDIRCFDIYFPSQSNGSPCFTAEIEGDLRTVAQRWREMAKYLADDNNVYVTCGIIDRGNGKLVISGEAHPDFVRKTAVWTNNVRLICQVLGIKPKFESANRCFVAILA